MSMNTKDYKTKTMVVERDFPCRDNYWAVGLDIGYSAVKGISPAHYFCFPAYAKKIPENRPLLKEAADTDIRYRDNEGEWVVGNLAYEEIVRRQKAVRPDWITAEIHERFGRS